ncbi:MAG: hypothetical protein H6706_18635 [Myxococcales bacterium]|nr:hypothetical protein [Myxococcales bacterium]
MLRDDGLGQLHGPRRRALAGRPGPQGAREHELHLAQRLGGRRGGRGRLGARPAERVDGGEPAQGRIRRRPRPVAQAQQVAPGEEAAAEQQRHHGQRHDLARLQPDFDLFPDAVEIAHISLQRRTLQASAGRRGGRNFGEFSPTWVNQPQERP